VGGDIGESGADKEVVVPGGADTIRPERGIEGDDTDSDLSDEQGKEQQEPSTHGAPPLPDPLGKDDASDSDA
jgi:hypothetical protein